MRPLSFKQIVMLIIVVSMVLELFFLMLGFINRDIISLLSFTFFAFMALVTGVEMAQKDINNKEK